MHEAVRRSVRAVLLAFVGLLMATTVRFATFVSWDALTRHSQPELSWLSGAGWMWSGSSLPARLQGSPFNCSDGVVRERRTPKGSFARAVSLRTGAIVRVPLRSGQLCERRLDQADERVQCAPSRTAARNRCTPEFLVMGSRPGGSRSSIASRGTEARGALKSLSDPYTRTRT